MIPKISITLQSGGLGSVGGSNDGVAGLVIGCDPATSGIIAGTKFVLRSMADAKTAKLDLIPYAYQQVKEFYDEAGEGSKLYVLICADTETLTNMADIAGANAYGKKLIDYAQGEITMLGVCRMPAAGYAPTVVKGLDDEVITALAKMQALAANYHALFTPFVGIIEGRKYMGTPATLEAINLGSSNFCGIVLGTSTELKAIDPMASSVGLLLGRAASVPVQRKVARVKDGGLAIGGAFYNSVAVEYTDFISIATKGYITIGMYGNKVGYYFLDDTLATVVTDDYKTISNRRVMNKMVRLVYATYINELNDDIELTSEGKLSPATAKYYQGLIENAVNIAMTANGELSSFSAYVDMNQNVLSSGKIYIKTSAVPKGYSQEINVTLGLSNPVLSV
jgi:hypothetical protein